MTKIFYTYQEMCMLGGYVVEEEIIERADKCPFGRYCLENPDIMCRADRDLNRKYVILEEENKDGSCPYMLDGGAIKACECPVRVKMFLKYGK